MRTIIIPGNPPAKYFYNLWAKEMGAKHDVVFPPFYPNLKNSGQYFERVVDHYAEFLKAQNQPVKLIGHSLGGNYALRLLVKVPQLIQSCSLVCPFIYRPHFKARAILSFLSFLSKRDGLRGVIINNRNIFKIRYPELVHVEPQEFHESATVAHHEHKALQGFPEQLPQSELDKLKVYYTPKDVWCSHKMIQNHLDPSVKTQILESIRHDFVINKEQRDIVSRALLKTIT